MTNIVCPVCSGLGWILLKSNGIAIDVDCDFCVGSGSVDESREFDT